MFISWFFTSEFGFVLIYVFISRPPRDTSWKNSNLCFWFLNVASFVKWKTLFIIRFYIKHTHIAWCLNVFLQIVASLRSTPRRRGLLEVRRRLRGPGPGRPTWWSHRAALALLSVEGLWSATSGSWAPLTAFKGELLTGATILAAKTENMKKII